ncbi:MAG: hypothetical protein IJM88_00285 [Bacteroidales bacterium]|nr:hypothetical protein [Bacteroidales bacterium]
MFDFLKRNKTLPTFAPLVTDIHCHLLPQVDDGSRSVEESLQCLEAMAETGLKEVRLTPHFHRRYPNQVADIEERYRHFCAEVEAAAATRQLPTLRGVTGEYSLDDHFASYVQSGQLLTTTFADPARGAEKGMLIVEFSLHQKRMGYDEMLYERLMDGYDLVLAHPERYPYYDGHSPVLERFKEQGIYFQVNILSLDGFYGEAAQRKAFEMIENGWVEFLATDMHNAVYAQALRHASANRRIIKLMERVEFENHNLVVR